jgi:hypothetical protein
VGMDRRSREDAVDECRRERCRKVNVGKKGKVSEIPSNRYKEWEKDNLHRRVMIDLGEVEKILHPQAQEEQ